MGVRKWPLLVALFVVSLAPARPAAAGDIWDVIAYLHELSGPGPFNGGVFSAEVFCHPKWVPVGPCADNRDAVKFYVVGEVGIWDDDPNPKFQGDVRLRSYQAIVYVPGHRTPGIRSWKYSTGIDFGAGLGLYRFSGPGVQQGPLLRASIPVRLRLTPTEFFASHTGLRDKPKARLFLRAFTYHVGFDVLPQGFSENSFVATPGYSSGAHALWTNALVVDGFVLVGSLFR